MSEMDEKTKTFVDRILFIPGTSHPNVPTSHPSPSIGHPSSETARPSKGDLASIAPFAIEPLTPVYSTQASNSTGSAETLRSYVAIGATASKLKSGGRLDREPDPFERPAIFGPERLVLDPRIKAVHRRLMFDVVAFGLCVMAVSALFVRYP
jgi:hypothetical protein